MRVSGRKEGWPQLPDGIFLPDQSQDSKPVQMFIESAKRGVLGPPLGDDAATEDEGQD